MKTALFYYTQSGQALQAAKYMVHDIDRTNISQGDDEVVFKVIEPIEDYPFPWPKDTFFDTFPETRLGMPPSGIRPISMDDIADADMVMIVGQSWFLSPSLPLQSFFLDKDVRAYLKGRPVVFVNVCRNMWLSTIHKVKDYLRDIDARLVGHIVLQDEAHNLVSLVTIIRWLVYGKKEATRLLPAAGVSAEVMQQSARFGGIIKEAWQDGKLDQLQDRLLDQGAIIYKPSVIFMERVGHRMFGIWAKFIRRKGGFRDPARLRRVNLFYIYLMTVLIVVSPIGQLIFMLTSPIHRPWRRKQADCGVA